MFHVSKLSPWFWMKPILRRGHRNTSCRISNRTREGITPFPSETSTFVWTNWLLLRTSSTIRSQVTGDWSFKKTADGRTNHASVPSPASERMQREKKRVESSTDWTSLHRSLLIPRQFYLSVTGPRTNQISLWRSIFFSLIRHYWPCLFAQDEMR